MLLPESTSKSRCLRPLRVAFPSGCGVVFCISPLLSSSSRRIQAHFISFHQVSSHFKIFGSRCLESPGSTAARQCAEAPAVLGEGFLQERHPDLLAQWPREDRAGDAIAQVAGKELVDRHSGPPKRKAKLKHAGHHMTSRRFRAFSAPFCKGSGRCSAVFFDLQCPSRSSFSRS